MRKRFLTALVMSLLVVLPLTAPAENSAPKNETSSQSSPPGPKEQLDAKQAEKIIQNFKERYERLERERMYLENEYNDIIKRKRELESVTGSSMSRDDYREYQEEVAQLKSRIEKYKQRMSAHETELREYNTELDQLNLKGGLEVKASD